MGDYLIHLNLQIAIIATILATVHAEAVADPAVLYANAYHPYGHYGYGYGLGNPGSYDLGQYSYGAGFYGQYGAYSPYGPDAKGLESARKRRDADADAEAQSAAAYYYGGYYGGNSAYPYGQGNVYGSGGYNGGYYGVQVNRNGFCFDNPLAQNPCDGVSLKQILMSSF